MCVISSSSFGGRAGCWTYVDRATDTGTGAPVQVQTSLPSTFMCISQIVTRPEEARIWSWSDSEFASVALCLLVTGTQRDSFDSTARPHADS